MTARLRLILAILALTLAPMLASVWSGVALAAPVPPSVSADHHGCADPCDDGVPVNAQAHDHAGSAACAALCGLHAVMPPLAVLAAAVPMVAEIRRPFPRKLSQTSTRWPPPLRPPRS
ncbi:MAG TPA: hypothetical protein VK196_18345 [Magnetospirillum sp.]|nr:hypothetical protein [Magnetospirillum sp.]